MGTFLIGCYGGNAWKPSQHSFLILISLITCSGEQIDLAAVYYKQSVEDEEDCAYIASPEISQVIPFRGTKQSLIMKSVLGIVPWIVVLLASHAWSTPVGYLIWGTPFLYKSESFVVNPKANELNGPAFRSRFGYRGADLIANLNQSIVKTNAKLVDVEDSTRSYKSPLSHW